MKDNRRIRLEDFYNTFNNETKKPSKESPKIANHIDLLIALHKCKTVEEFIERM